MRHRVARVQRRHPRVAVLVEVHRERGRVEIGEPDIAHRHGDVLGRLDRVGIGAVADLHRHRVGVLSIVVAGILEIGRLDELQHIIEPQLELLAVGAGARVGEDRPEQHIVLAEARGRHLRNLHRALSHSEWTRAGHLRGFGLRPRGAGPARGHGQQHNQRTRAQEPHVEPRRRARSPHPQPSRQRTRAQEPHVEPATEPKRRWNDCRPHCS